MENSKEKLYELAFEIINHAGSSKSNSLLAVEAARNFEFSKADEFIEKAKSEYLECHKVQTDLLQKEAAGENTELNLIFVHAQDHLTMANMSMDFAREFRNLYEIISKLNR